MERKEMPEVALDDHLLEDVAGGASAEEILENGGAMLMTPIITNMVVEEEGLGLQ